MDPLAELQHRHRNHIHDLKGNFALARNAVTLYQRDHNVMSLLHAMLVLRDAFARQLDEFEPGWRERAEIADIPVIVTEDVAPGVVEMRDPDGVLLGRVHLGDDGLTFDKLSVKSQDAIEAVIRAAYEKLGIDSSPLDKLD